MHCEKKRRRRTQRVENKKRSCFFRLSGFLLMNLQIQKDEGGQENVIEGRKQW